MSELLAYCTVPAIATLHLLLARRAKEARAPLLRHACLVAGGGQAVILMTVGLLFTFPSLIDSMRIYYAIWVLLNLSTAIAIGAVISFQHKLNRAGRLTLAAERAVIA